MIKKCVLLWLLIPVLSVASEAATIQPETTDANLVGTHYLIDGGTGDTVSVGALALTMPQYAGSSDQRALLFPVATVKWGDQKYFFSTLNGVGMNVLQKPKDYKLGFALNLNWGRQASASKDLDGMGDISPYALAVLFGQYRVGPVLLHAKFEQGLQASRGYSIESGFDLFAKINQKLVMFVGPTLSYGSQDYMQSFYGVSSNQSVSSGYQVYHPSSGFDLLKWNWMSVYKVDDHWRAVAYVSYMHVLSKAADAGFIQSRNQALLGIGANYLF